MTDPTLIDALALPVAAREQAEIIPADYVMTEAARVRHPAVRWWWGERRVENANGAYCYLCDRLVATWDRRWPTPALAIEIVLLHRSHHRPDAGSTFGIDTAGTSPAGDAPPMEGQR